ncbi:MAG TPA: DNA recombination protein RmuC [Paludibacteraceae bacterium]|nr:DNA recombination protein RmuC [Paludibacteraceae bacterium]
MVEFIIIIAASVLVGCIVFFIVRGSSDKSIQDLRRQINEKEREITRLNTLLGERNRLLDAFRSKSDKNEELITSLRKEKEQLRAQVETQLKEIEMLKEHNNEDSKQRQVQFDKHLVLVQEKLKGATEELLKQRELQLSDANKKQMDAIITPLRETIGEMKKTVEASRESHTKETATLEQQIKNIMERSSDIGLKADNLAKALKNDNPKMQGNWGEIVLNELLESQGLVKGKHFDTQSVIRDDSSKALIGESDRRMIPDVILHYPDGKDVVIDSKVSLTAFVDYQNAESDEERNMALRRHVDSVKGHIQELSKKNYSNYLQKSRKFINYVIMFVPNEMAMQLALYNDNHLWRNAFERGVFITSEQNLIALLRMIELAWSQVEQNKNQAEIIKRAEELLKRVGDFINRFEKIGIQLSSLSNEYEGAKKKLYAGQQSIVSGANKLISLGVKSDGNKSIPEEVSDL